MLLVGTTAVACSGSGPTTGPATAPATMSAPAPAPAGLDPAAQRCPDAVAAEDAGAPAAAFAEDAVVIDVGREIRGRQAVRTGRPPRSSAASTPCSTTPRARAARPCWSASGPPAPADSAPATTSTSPPA
ncbi:hypothetical protein [Streptomyces sp. NPDC003832]